MLTPDKIEKRKRKILFHIVRSYIETAFPVASKTLVYRYRLDFSPATVRNIMAELEELGYLMHPHTSAGRIPTDRGYRYYVDMIMEEEQLNPSERKKILMQLINTQWEEIDSLLEQAVEIISDYTGQLGILLHNRKKNIYVEKIDLIYINKHKMLFVIVADSGEVLHLFVESEHLPKLEELNIFLTFLNNEFVGEPLSNIRNKIKVNLISSPNPLYNVFSETLTFLMDILEKAEEKEFFYQGANKIVKYPEFNEPGNLTDIIDLLERKVELIKILEADFKKDDLNIHIGRENIYQRVHNCSIITARYKIKGRPLGIIGVLGSTRLPYGRVVSVLKYVAQVLGQAIEGAIF